MKNPLTKTICTVTAGLLVLSSAVALTGCGKSKTDEYSEIKWPDSALAKMLPTPKSTTGKIITDSSDSLSIYIAETSKDDYSEYVDNCKENGFTVDYNNSDSYYTAENEDGYSLTLSYNDEKVMDISLYAPDEDSDKEESSKEESSKEDSSKEESSKEESSKKESSKEESSKSDEVNADFKNTMDAYEDFFNEYVDFMKKYKDSDDVVGMMADYTEYMSKYADMMSKMDEIDTDDLSAADAAYYAEVYARILDKISEVE